MWSFMFFIMGLAGVIGIAIGLLFFLPLFIYVIPYTTWVGWNQGTKGIPSKQASDNLPAAQQLLHNTRNATKLYRSWINKQPHNITDW